VSQTAPGAGKVFISYRRRETAGHAGRLYDRLVEHFGNDRVFMDLRMEPGVDFVEQIDEAVAECAALLSVIGVADMFYEAKLVAVDEFRPFELYSAAAVLIVAVTLIAASVAGLAERWLSRGYR
jgi:hypothetical protein